ncbi:MAG: helix-turn-helix domain-containing protein [Firmicutes bacterium]|nr:helix-turn-helix domain-containing protein [Bacillota bacterium]
MIDTNKVAEAITYLRKRAGYTQKDLAARIGISDKAVSKWERGISLPDTALLGKLSILLDTDTDSLLAGDVINHDSRWGGVLKIRKNEYGIYAGTVIYDKPLVYYLLGNFMLLGIKNIIIDCDDESREFIKNDLGDGSKYGISISFDHDAYTAANYMVVLGNSIIYGVDQTRFLQKAMTETDRLTVLSLPKGLRSDEQGLRFDANKRIVDIGDEDQVTTQYSYFNIPVFYCTAEQLKEMGGIEGLTDSSINSIDIIYTEVLDRGFVELPINTWDDVNEAAQFVKTIQKACGMELYCLEEIAWRRGLITTEQLREYGQAQAGNQHGRYILGLVATSEE